jgi:hypothetical protein
VRRHRAIANLLKEFRRRLFDFGGRTQLPLGDFVLAGDLGARIALR